MPGLVYDKEAIVEIFSLKHRQPTAVGNDVFSFLASGRAETISNEY